jgi:hypothetical protein
VFKGTGDGVMARFASARRAVICAAGIQLALEESNRERGDASVAVRVGVNSGEVNEEADDIFGTAVNAAARVAAKAKGGQILVSGVVKQLAGQVPGISFVDRGRFRLKGFDERWQLFEVIWKREAERTRVTVHLAVEFPLGLRMVPLDAGRVTIGRGIENSVALAEDQKVSRLHASLEDYGAGWSIEDLGSRNGTYVNGSRLSAKQALRPGDEIKIGDTVIHYQSSLAREQEAGATLVDETQANTPTVREHEGPR